MREPDDLNIPNLRDRAVRAARGGESFDLLLVGGTVVDVATGELRAADVGLVGPLIASVHAPGSRRDAAQRIDIPGKFIAPGLIDTHLHIESSMVTPRPYAETVVPQGTTTICWDPHELGNVLGLAGVRWGIDAAQNLPLRILTFAPSCVPSAPGLELAGADFEAPEMATMFAWPEIAGVAEVMDMRGVLDRTAHMQGIVGAGLNSGKLVCGHARGLTGNDLQAFGAAGMESDHELTSGEDLLEKVRAGFTIELRGSHDYVLPGIVAALQTLPRFPQTVTICTDDIFPDDLVADGGIIDVLRRLVRYGLPPVDALQAATLNAAARLRRRDLGLVAPGRRADLIVLDELAAMRVAHVFASGRHVAADGRLIELARATPPLPPDTMHLQPVTADAFRLRANGASVRLRTVAKPRFTEWGEITAPVRNGIVALPDDAIIMAMLHRHARAPSTPVLGILQGWSTWRGAIATSVMHDSHNLTVFGRDPADMATAANAVISARGGMAVAAGGAVRALLPLPICGLVSDAPTQEVGDAFAKIKAAANEIVDWQPPLLTFKAIVGASLACNPGPHVTDRGITDGSTGEVFAGALIAAE
jgi:adenine deaminase